MIMKERNNDSAPMVDRKQHRIHRVAKLDAILAFYLLLFTKKIGIVEAVMIHDYRKHFKTGKIRHCTSVAYARTRQRNLTLLRNGKPRCIPKIDRTQLVKLE